MHVARVASHTAKPEGGFAEMSQCRSLRPGQFNVHIVVKLHVRLNYEEVFKDLPTTFSASGLRGLENSEWTKLNQDGFSVGSRWISDAAIDTKLLRGIRGRIDVQYGILPIHGSGACSLGPSPCSIGRGAQAALAQ